MNEELVLAEHVCNTNFKDLSPELVRLTKLDILDNFACSLAGSTMPGTSDIVDLVKEWGGAQESWIIAFGGKVPAPMAAMANTIMAATRDYDDAHHGGEQHPGAATIPAAFAIANKMGKVSGQELITAVAVGLDVQIKLGYAAITGQRAMKWHRTAILGAFGAATAGAKLFKLSKEQVIGAWGLALSQTAGVTNLGTYARPFQTGNSCRGGVTAAILAQRNFLGSPGSFSGPTGLYETHFDDYKGLDALTDNLGKRFEGIDMKFKIWPTSTHVQNGMEAAIQLVKDNNISAEDIQRVILYSTNQENTPPLLSNPRPATIAEAQFSKPFAIAVAIIKGGMHLKDVGEEGIRDSRILSVSDKVELKQADTELINLGEPGSSPSRVVIEMKNGQTYNSKPVPFPYGHPRNPMQRDDFIEKFRDCADSSIKPLPKETVGKLISLFDHLEELEDVSEITRLAI